MRDRWDPDEVEKRTRAVVDAPLGTTEWEEAIVDLDRYQADFSLRELLAHAREVRALREFVGEMRRLVASLPPSSYARKRLDDALSALDAAREGKG